MQSFPGLGMQLYVAYNMYNMSVVAAYVLYLCVSFPGPPYRLGPCVYESWSVSALVYVICF